MRTPEKCEQQSSLSSLPCRRGREPSSGLPSEERENVSFSRGNIWLRSSFHTTVARPECSPKRRHSAKWLGSQTSLFCPRKPALWVCPCAPRPTLLPPTIGALRLKVKLSWLSSGAASAAYQHQPLRRASLLCLSFLPCKVGQDGAWSAWDNPSIEQRKPQALDSA